MAFTREQITEFINDLIIEPRKNASKWSEITKQTAHLRVGYPGQHLASLVTGVEGERTGARGNDLADGSEVKTCSRVGQLDKCLNCKSPVLRTELNCSNCDSTNIQRKNDSKWLFSIRSENELKTLVDNPNLDRVVLVIDDYPGFDNDDFDEIRIQVFEIYPKIERHKKFKEIMINYYNKIYLEHIKVNPVKIPAPKNFWPYTFQFYMTNPILIFCAIIKDAYSNDPKLTIEKWIKHDVDRKELTSEIMPPKILKICEHKTIAEKVPREKIELYLYKDIFFEDYIRTVKNGTLNDICMKLKGVSEEMRSVLDLRDTDKITIVKDKYKRRDTKDKQIQKKLQ